jgi:hypothetical protein
VRTLSQQQQPDITRLSDEQLMARIHELSVKTGGGRLTAGQAELTRRLMVRIVELNGTTAALGGTTEALRQEMQISGQRMIRLTRVLIWLTGILVALTIALVYLTVQLME